MNRREFSSLMVMAPLFGGLKMASGPSLIVRCLEIKADGNISLEIKGSKENISSFVDKMTTYFGPSYRECHKDDLDFHHNYLSLDGWLECFKPVLKSFSNVSYPGFLNLESFTSGIESRVHKAVSVLTLADRWPAYNESERTSLSVDPYECDPIKYTRYFESQVLYSSPLCSRDYRVTPIKKHEVSFTILDAEWDEKKVFRQIKEVADDLSTMLKGRGLAVFQEPSIPAGIGIRSWISPHQIRGNLWYEPIRQGVVVQFTCFSR